MVDSRKLDLIINNQGKLPFPTIKRKGRILITKLVIILITFITTNPYPAVYSITKTTLCERGPLSIGTTFRQSMVEVSKLSNVNLTTL